ncbi:hypothetical protein [Legionella fallonii]|uniref:Dot/Icm T4SS effector n=1 Tax=Legionella fallonii LLAP-10 TaxID=1212491 RepID=A0A098G522_9GAMM|nr:hypothetical protein [Legionella fallonii]CEG57567.1 Dot/Icm T4SS effector [Legionella fallonii LLAP-10]
MTKVLIFTDFDGTITSKEGSKTVFGEFYQSLMDGYEVGKIQRNYKHTPLKSPEEVQKIFEAKFGKYDSNFNYTQKDTDVLMSADAVAFFKQALNNSSITVKIITKNRQDYIHALLKYHGFSAEEIGKLTIDDTGWKNNAIHTSLRAPENNTSKPTHIYILDDNPADFDAMVSAAESPEYGYEATQIKKYNQDAGQFQWAQYQQDIQALFPLPVEEQPITPTPIETGTDSRSTPPIAITEDKSEPVPVEPLAAQRTLKITGTSFAAGFFVGLLVSVVLIATGVLAPLGIGALGILALTSMIASGLGLVSGVIGFGVAKSTESKKPHQCDEPTPSNNCSQPLQGLGGPVDTVPRCCNAPVKHFPSIIGNSPEATETQQKSEERHNTDLGARMNVQVEESEDYSTQNSALQK